MEQDLLARQLAETLGGAVLAVATFKLVASRLPNLGTEIQTV
jgi:hypothetical protein